jgi:hypothetical protein
MNCLQRNAIPSTEFDEVLDRRDSDLQHPEEVEKILPAR